MCVGGVCALSAGFLKQVSVLVCAGVRTLWDLAKLVHVPDPGVCVHVLSAEFTGACACRGPVYALSGVWRSWSICQIQVCVCARARVCVCVCVCETELLPTRLTQEG